MSLEVKGGVELRDDVARMADLLRASGGNGTRACNYILQTAAQPVLTRMLHNASTDPKRRSGTLYNSIRIGRVVKKRSGGYRVTVGVHRADGGAKYASPVEFGHGGPHPAPPHGGEGRRAERFAGKRMLFHRARLRAGAPPAKPGGQHAVADLFLRAAR